jgi:nitrite reductase (NADH) large subunit
MVGAVLNCVLSGAGGVKTVIPICSCTTLSHEQVKEAIIANSYTNAAYVRADLDWNRSEGCQVCRAAIPYYLGLVDESDRNAVRLPYPVRFEISSNYLEPSDVLVRDFSLSAVPAGWEVYVGGHAEHPVKQAQLLAVEAEETNARQLAAACMQWYRESAYYGERPWKWLDRIGLLPLREKLLDLETQEELSERWQAAERMEMAWSGK